jgi:hypothetical protein
MGRHRDGLARHDRHRTRAIGVDFGTARLNNRAGCTIDCVGLTSSIEVYCTFLALYQVDRIVAWDYLRILFGGVVVTTSGGGTSCSGSMQSVGGSCALGSANTATARRSTSAVASPMIAPMTNAAKIPMRHQMVTGAPPTSAILGKDGRGNPGCDLVVFRGPSMGIYEYPRTRGFEGLTLFEWLAQA